MYGVGSAQYSPLQVGQLYTAAVDAQRRPVGLSGCGGPMGAEDSVGGAGEPHQPVGAHEGDEFSKRSHDAQQSPQHGAAGDNDMAHGCRRLEAVLGSTMLGWRTARSPSVGLWLPLWQTPQPERTLQTEGKSLGG